MAKLSKYIQLGGREIMRLGLGTNHLGDNVESREILKKAVELGINFIDTANKYGQSEQIIGETLAPYPKNLIIATKGGWSDDNDPNSLETKIDNSLRLLKLEQIYIWLLHRVDPNRPLEQTMNFLKGQVEAGKIRHLGLSEVSVEQIEAASKIAPIVCVQNRYNLVERENDEVIDYCEREGIVFIPFFPLSSGSLALNRRLQEVAGQYNANPIQIALAWLFKRSPAILPIPGTLNPSHLEQNLKALDIDLSDEDFRHLIAV